MTGMLVDEQPDQRSHWSPFVKPAGAMPDREKVYVTNAVKHFNFRHAQKFACINQGARIPALRR